MVETNKISSTNTISPGNRQRTKDDYHEKKRGKLKKIYCFSCNLILNSRQRNNLAVALPLLLNISFQSNFHNTHEMMKIAQIQEGIPY